MVGLPWWARAGSLTVGQEVDEVAARDTQDDAARVLVVDDDAALAEMVQILSLIHI